jgi:hypothetical protein
VVDEKETDHSGDDRDASAYILVGIQLVISHFSFMSVARLRVVCERSPGPQHPNEK